MMPYRWSRQDFTKNMSVSFINVLVFFYLLLNLGINCSISEMPNITADRTDVVTTGWDGITTSYETTVR